MSPIKKPPPQGLQQGIPVWETGQESLPFGLGSYCWSLWADCALMPTRHRSDCRAAPKIAPMTNRINYEIRRVISVVIISGAFSAINTRDIGFTEPHQTAPFDGAVNLAVRPPFKGPNFSETFTANPLPTASNRKETVYAYLLVHLAAAFSNSLSFDSLGSATRPSANFCKLE